MNRCIYVCVCIYIYPYGTCKSVTQVSAEFVAGSLCPRGAIYFPGLSCDTCQDRSCKVSVCLDRWQCESSGCVCVCARVPHPCTYTCVCCSACACWRNVGINSIYKLQTTIPAFRVLLGALAPHPQIYLEFLVMNRLKRKSLSSLRFLHK